MKIISLLLISGIIVKSIGPLSSGFYFSINHAQRYFYAHEDHEEVDRPCALCQHYLSNISCHAINVFEIIGLECEVGRHNRHSKLLRLIPSSNQNAGSRPLADETLCGAAHFLRFIPGQVKSCILST